MDCKISATKIIDFQFGTIGDADRDAVEHHLAQCPECLWEFFALKRDMDGRAEAPAVPSVKARAAIFSEFEEFRQRILPEEGRIWILGHRRRLIACGMLAAAAVLFMLFARFVPTAAIKTMAPDTMQVHTRSESVDTGRSSPEHINVL